MAQTGTNAGAGYRCRYADARHADELHYLDRFLGRACERDVHGRRFQDRADCLGPRWGYRLWCGRRRLADDECGHAGYGNSVAGESLARTSRLPPAPMLLAGLHSFPPRLRRRILSTAWRLPSRPRFHRDRRDALGRRRDDLQHVDAPGRQRRRTRTIGAARSTASAAHSEAQTSGTLTLTQPTQ